MRPYAWWIVWGVLAVMVLVMAASPQRPGADFEVFQLAAQRLLLGESLYQAADGHWLYKYAPAVAMVFVPFAPLSVRAGWVLINLLSTAALVRLMQWGSSRLGREVSLWTHLVVLLAANAYLTNLFRLGQVDAILIWLLIESIILAESRPWLSGALWATACLFKPPFLVFVPVALVCRQWRRLLALGAGALGWAGLGILLFGFSGNLEQMRAWRQILAGTTQELICVNQNQSVWAIVCSYIVRPETGLAYQIALAIVAGGLVALAGWVWLRIRAHDEQQAVLIGNALALYSTALLSPLGWRTNLLGAIPLFYLCLGLGRVAATPRLRRTALGAVILAVAGEMVCRSFWRDRMLEWRYFGVAVLVVAGTALAVAAIDAARRGGAPSSFFTMVPRPPA